MKSKPETRIDVSPDAAPRLARAEAWLKSFPSDSELLIVSHSNEAATDLLLRVVESKRGWFGVKRSTLNGLAARLARPALAESQTAPASNLSFTAVVARAIHSLHSDGKLNYFAPVATRPGFPVAVARTLEELRMNEVDAGALARMARGGKDLAAIATLVDQELNEAKLCDRAGLFRAALASLNSAENAAYVGLPILLLDVATRSRVENRLLQELSARSPRVLATLPKGDERTIAALEVALGCKRSELETALAADPAARSLSFAKQHLFASSAPPVMPLDASVTMQNWPGEPRECVEIVRSIQAEAARGVPFDQMAVLLNSPGEYRSHLEEAFSRAEIPAYFVRGTTAPDPAGRALLALLSCAADRLSAKRFAEYLSLGQVPDPEANKDPEANWVAPNDELIAGATEPERGDEVPAPIAATTIADPDSAAVVDGALRVPARWERLLVDSAVIGGKDRWSRRLAGLANEFRLRLEETAPEDEARVDSIKKQLQDLGALRAYALPLIERLAALPPQANWGEWLAHLRELAVNALRRPAGVLATFAELDPMSSVGPVDLYEVQLVLESRLHDLGVEPPRRRYGRVFVGPVDASRGLSFRNVFIPGLAERIFPRKIVDDPILPEAQRKATQLTTRRDQLEAERLGLRLAVGAARSRVYLSYPRIDVQQSRPRVPSFYALEALRAAKGYLPNFEEVAAHAEAKTPARLGWPAPERPEAALDESEYDLALLANLVESSQEEAQGAAHYLLGANAHLARALRARSRRWLKRWTANDGLVEADELARQSLAKHQFSARSFSATALQNYASCPYRFFLSAILRLDLRQEPAAIEAIDPLTRGSLFHETQFEVLTRLKERGLLPLGGAETVGASAASSTAFDLVDEELARLSADYEDRLAPAIPRVWQDGINSIKADLREWLRRMAANEEGWVPDKFELSFGLSDRGPRESDLASVAAPVNIVGDLKLRGSIDMVERQGNRYRVTDHKTGKARAADDTIVGGGKYLQPLLYALACQELLAGQVESGRLYYCTADGGYEERIVALNEANEATLNEVLIAIRQGLADAFLPAAPDKDACTWCDFLAVCGSFEEKRTSIKPRDRLVQIEKVRKLP
jgi:ATP-dependent helicase/nuclease subunit B